MGGSTLFRLLNSIGYSFRKEFYFDNSGLGNII